MISVQDIDASKQKWTDLEDWQIGDYLNKNHPDLSGLEKADVKNLTDYWAECKGFLKSGLGNEIIVRVSEIAKLMHKYPEMTGYGNQKLEEVVGRQFEKTYREYFNKKPDQIFNKNALLDLVVGVTEIQKNPKMKDFGTIAAIDAYRKCAEFCPDDLKNGNVTTTSLKDKLNAFYQKHQNVIDANPPTIRDFLKDGYNRTINQSPVFFSTTKTMRAKAVDVNNPNAHVIEFEGKNALGKTTFIARIDAHSGRYQIKTSAGEYTNMPDRKNIPNALGAAPRDMVEFFTQNYMSVEAKGKSQLQQLKNTGNNYSSYARSIINQVRS